MKSLAGFFFDMVLAVKYYAKDLVESIGYMVDDAMDVFGGGDE